MLSLADLFCRPTRQLGRDAFIEVTGGELRRNANRVFNCLGVRASMADDANAFQSEKWGSSVFGVIDSFFEVLKCTLCQQRPKLAAETLPHRLTKHFANNFYETLADFERHIAYEAVANNDIDGSGVHITPFHVANEVQI